MKTLARRRVFNLALFGALSLLLALGVRSLALRLYDTSLLTGGSLLAILLALALFNGRKKLPFLPLGSASAWLQFHLYAGALSGVVFLLHIRGRVPGGLLESTLAVAFVLVFGSGIAGIFLSRNLARRLTSRGQEVIFERIPALRKQIRERAEALALASVEEHATTALADFYARRLFAYFDGPGNVLLHLVESERPRRRWTEEFAAIDRYLNDAEREYARELARLVQMKEDLDYHHALQAVLKLWLFVHVPLTYALLILAVFHGLLALGFSAGLR